MIEKIRAAMGLLKKGRQVADPKKWRNRRNATAVITGLLWAAVQVAEVWGYHLPVTPEIVDGVAAVLAGGVWVVLSITTNDTKGLPDKSGAGTVSKPDRDAGDP